MTWPTRSLLDTGQVPVGALAGFARREARRPRPIYGAHKWFARRFGTAFRALLVAATTPHDGDFWAGYYENVDLRGHTVLDTFVGGGTALVEAQRLGASVIGVDVDPVAAAVTKFELNASGQPDIDVIASKLHERAAKKLAPFHATHGVDGEERTVLHHFWVQAVDCAGCGRTVEAHPSYRLAANPDGSRQWIICRKCGDILERPGGKAAARCGTCRALTRVDEGVVTAGTMCCPDCGHRERLIDVAERTGKPPVWRLFALEVLDIEPTRRSTPLSQRSFQVATDRDRALVEEAEIELQERQKEGRGVIPEDYIPLVRTDDRLLRYGYVQYRDLFNPRQLLHLSVLLEEISGLSAAEKEVAALAFSNHLTTTCMLTSYASGWRRLVPLFSLRAFRHVPRPVEVNPWLLGTGRGTYPNALRQVRAAVDFSRNPKEFTKEGFTPVPSIAPLAPPKVVCGSAEDLSHVESESVSLVLSDPPYLDNIAYSELSDFFAPWLRATGVISSEDPEAARRTSLAASNRKARAASDFATRLGKCFQEAARVLNSTGRVVFTYQHATAIGWLGLAQALSTAALKPVQVFPLQGDGGLGLHAHEGNSIFDAILVLRRAPLLAVNSDEDAGNVEFDLTISLDGEATALGRANQWERKLNGEIPGVYRVPDDINLKRAFLICAALEERFERPAGERKLLLQSLIDVAEPSFAKAC